MHRQQRNIRKTLFRYVTVSYTHLDVYKRQIYEPTMHVIVLKCKDGSWAKLQFTVAGNSETNKSGFVTFNYEFIPIK